MFRQLVTPGHPGANPTPTVKNYIDCLFTYHPLQLSAIIETFWLNRSNAANTQMISPFLPWPPQIAYPILSSQFFTGYSWSSAGIATQLLPQPPNPPLLFIPPAQQPGILDTANGSSGSFPKHATNWDHLIYAYVIENTRIFEIFSKVLETYMFSEQLETPSPASQSFWRNVEFLIFGDAMPSMVWTTSTRLRRDE